MASIKLLCILFWKLLTPYFVLFFFFVPRVSSQLLSNGQLYTNGLSIVDAPAPESTFHFGSDIPIAIDVSGNGQLPVSASVPGNSGKTGYDGLDIYLVSSQTNTNVTVSYDSGILKDESGSTVKHLNWQMPSCLSSGEYNLTLYECARINSQFYYTITPIPIEVDNPYPSGPCTSGANPLQDQPQASSPPPESPFLPTDDPPDPWPPSAPASSGFVTIPSHNPYQYTTMSNGQTVTVTASGMPTTVTIVLVSTEVLTSMGPGETSVFTTTETSSSTTTAVVNAPSDTSGFLPVNAGSSHRCIPFWWLMSISLIMALITSCWHCNI